MKFEFDYITRADNKWEFRLLKDTKINIADKIYETFYDIDYGGKKKSHIAALAFSEKTLRELPGRIISRLRSGYPKFKVKSGVYLVTRYGEPNAYLAKVYNKFTGEIKRKTYSFLVKRTKDQAHRLAKKFRREQVKIVQRIAIKHGFLNSNDTY
jgi:hypothetical protein